MKDARHKSKSKSSSSLYDVRSVCLWFRHTTLRIGLKAFVETAESSVRRSVLTIIPSINILF